MWGGDKGRIEGSRPGHWVEQINGRLLLKWRSGGAALAVSLMKESHPEGRVLGFFETPERISSRQLETKLQPQS